MAGKIKTEPTGYRLTCLNCKRTAVLNDDDLDRIVKARAPGTVRKEILDAKFQPLEEKS